MGFSEPSVRPVAVQPAPLRQSAAGELGVEGARPMAFWLQGVRAECSPWLLPGSGGALLVAPAARLHQALRTLPSDVADQVWRLAQAEPRRWRLRDRELPIGERTYVMGILNVTPDSFSDGGRFAHVEEAVRRAQQLLHAGADLLDIGAESTRPGAVPIEVEEELRRITPVLEELRDFPLPISVDTYKWPVAERALKLGAAAVNDVWSGLRDPAMLAGVGRAKAGLVLMHNRRGAAYERIGLEVQEFLRERLEAAIAAGVDRSAIALDPGVGFGKRPEHSHEVLRRLQELRAFGQPVLIGTSRKGFIGAASGRDVDGRAFGTAATVALGIAFGADIVRVHDVAEMLDAARVADALVRR